MTRVLFIARYRNALMERKLELMAQEPDLALWLVRPRAWRDEFGAIAIQTRGQGYRTSAVRMLGRANDPHRALYGTLTFALPAARPDIIHVEEEPDSLATLQVMVARRLLAPHALLVLHTWQNINRRKGPAVQWLTRLSLRQADAILCANQEGVTVLREMTYAGPAAVIPPLGVDLALFRPGAPRAASETLNIVYAGRLAPEKGLDTLLSALRGLGPQARLRLIGAGPQRDALAAATASLGVEGQVEFSAAVSADQMPACLAEADVLVLPSRTTPVWKEQFGRVLVEAMSCGTPVIGSDSGAIPEVIGDAGLIFAEGDAEALAACLRRLAQSPELRRELGERGRRRVAEHYTVERIARQTVELWRGLLAARPQERGVQRAAAQ
jgi:glycosyltransferase involved in cell wall biosynthesis